VSVITTVNAALCDYHVRNCDPSPQLTEVCNKVSSSTGQAAAAGDRSSRRQQQAIAAAAAADTVLWQLRRHQQKHVLPVAYMACAMLTSCITATLLHQLCASTVVSCLSACLPACYLSTNLSSLRQAFQLFYDVDQEIKDLEWHFNCTDHNVSGTAFVLNCIHICCMCCYVASPGKHTIAVRCIAGALLQDSSKTNMHQNLCTQPQHALIMRSPLHTIPTSHHHSANPHPLPQPPTLHPGRRSARAGLSVASAPRCRLTCRTTAACPASSAPKRGPAPRGLTTSSTQWRS
jgi:hypothetical protein